jgi:hypothetical protein
MKGYDAFLKIADIREDFLDEAYLPALFPVVKSPKKKKILAPLAALFSNRAVAAVLCGVLGLGVLTAVIGLSPLNPFRDNPVTEPPVTDTAEPTDTPPVSEEGSVRLFSILQLLKASARMVVTPSGSVSVLRP